MSKLFYSQHHNCLEIIVAANLERMGIKHQLFFDEAGFYFKNQDNELKVFPQFSIPDKKLKEKFGIVVERYKYNNSNDYIYKLDNLLENGKFPTVTVDSFSLPYSLSYNNKHNYHAVEIVGQVENEYLVNDYLYKYDGKISKEVLENAIIFAKKYINNKDSEIMVYLKSEEVLQEKPIIEILENNYKIMKGEKILDLKQSINGTVGIEGIIKFKDHILQLVRDQDYDTLHKMFYSVKNLSSSRYHLHDLTSMNGIEELSDRYLDSFQNWSVLMNMLLILFYEKNNIDSMYLRIEKRLDKIVNTEKKCMEMCGSIILEEMKQS